MQLVGKQMVDFVNQQTGEQVKGIKLHFTCPDDRVSGLAASTQFIRSSHACYDKAVNIALGEFTIIYGQKGSVVDLISVPTK